MATFEDGPFYAEWSRLCGRLNDAWNEIKALRAQRTEMMERKRRTGVAHDQIEFNIITGRIRQLEEEKRGLNTALATLDTVIKAALRADGGAR